MKNGLHKVEKKSNFISGGDFGPSLLTQKLVTKTEKKWFKLTNRSKCISIIV